MSTYIFLDPDGTQEFGLLVVVAAGTGVTYAHQCGGLATETRELEGFLVPVGGPAASRRLREFFRRRFRGNPPWLGEGPDAMPGAAWPSADLEELQALVGEIAFWKTSRHGDGEDRQAFLELDTARCSDLTEAWVPVKTVYGPGVLVFENSD